MATVAVPRDAERLRRPRAPAPTTARGPRSIALRGLPYALVAAVLSTLYVRTLLPSVGFAMDTAKFDYLGRVLGTGHPPGEPLYLILDAAWVHAIPGGDWAWRANLLSAVIGVLCALVLVRVLRELNVGRWLAAGGATLIGVSRLFWQQSIIAEVYSLNNLFLAVELCLLLMWLRTRRDWLLLVSLGTFELSFSNHPMGLFLIPGLAVFLYRTKGYRALLRPRSLLSLLGCGVLTLSTYGYIVWRSLDPRTPYVELDIHSVGSFWSGITAQEFQHDMFGYTAVHFFTDRVPFGLYHMWLQYYALLAVAIWGAAVLWRRRRLVAELTLLWVVAVAVFATDYEVSDAQVFYLVGWMVMGLWLTLGLQDLARRAGRELRRRGLLGTLAARRAPVALALTAPLALALVNYPQVNLAGSDTKQVVSRDLAALPRDSIVFTPTYAGFQEMNYFLVPYRRGRVEHKYVQLGMGKVEPDGDVTLTGRFARYCLKRRPMRLKWIRTTVPGHLNVFVYTRAYARKIAGQGFFVHHYSGGLYGVECW